MHVHVLASLIHYYACEIIYVYRYIHVFRLLQSTVDVHVYTCTYMLYMQAQRRRDDEDESFVFPYDLGCRRNLAEV